MDAAKKSLSAVLAHRNGMTGTYFAAAELTRRGLIVTVTSRNAKGADLLVTDESCLGAWSVQVKTNGKPLGFWLLSRHYRQLVSPSHVYVFVNLRGEQPPDLYVVRSADVARLGTTKIQGPSKSAWHEFKLAHARECHDWGILTRAEPTMPRASEEKVGVDCAAFAQPWPA